MPEILAQKKEIKYTASYPHIHRVVEILKQAKLPCRHKGNSL